MNYKHYLLLFVLVLAGCGDELDITHPISIPQLKMNAEQLLQKEVQVEGVLSMVPSFRIYVSDHERLNSETSGSIRIMHLNTDVELF